MAITGAEVPILTMPERSALVSAFACFSSAIPATMSVAVYRRNASGGVQTVLASIDGAGAGATAWVAFRSKPLKLPTASIVCEPGDTITAISNGATLTLTWRRVDD